MTNFTKLDCSYCKHKFNSDDDIVVCPKCGAPYHRECYNKEGHCIFEDKHDSEFKWEPPASDDGHASDASSQQNNKVCKRCNAQNNVDASFCNKCGFPLINPVYPTNLNENKIPTIPFIVDPLGGLNPDDKINDIPVKEVADFVQTNTPYYLTVFKKIKDFNISRFNFCAFLFSGGWMLYRKQYVLGTIITLLVGIFTFSSSYISYNYTVPILKTMLSSVNLDINTVSMPTLASVISQQLPLLPLNQALLLVVPSVLSVLNWVIMFVVGLLGNRLYFKHCISKISTLKASLNKKKYKEQLKLKGGVNTQLGICLLICYIIILIF